MTCPNKAKKWVRHKNYCYYFSSGLDKKDLRTWFEVPLRCSELYPSVENELVTRLTIHSEEEKVNTLLYIFLNIFVILLFIYVIVMRYFRLLRCERGVVIIGKESRTNVQSSNSSRAICRANVLGKVQIYLFSMEMLGINCRTYWTPEERKLSIQNPATTATVHVLTLRLKWVKSLVI